VRHRIGMGALILLIMLLIGTDIRAETFYLNWGGTAEWDYSGSWLQPDPQNPRVPGAQDQVIIWHSGSSPSIWYGNMEFVDAMTVSVVDPGRYSPDFGLYLTPGSGLSIAQDLVIETGIGFFQETSYLPGSTPSVSVGHDLVVGAQGALSLGDCACWVGHAVSISGILDVGGPILQTPSMTITGPGAKVILGSGAILSSANGTLMISGRGTLRQVSGTSLTVGSNGFSSITVTGPGSNWRVDGGPLSIGPGGTVTITGGGRMSAGTLSMDGGTVTVTQGSTLSACTISGTGGTLTVTQGSTLSASTISATGGTLTVTQGSTLSASTIGATGFPVTITQGSTFDGEAIVGGSVNVDASSRIKGSITVSSGGILSQDSGILNACSIAVTDPGSQYTNSGDLILGGDAGTWAYVGAYSGGSASITGNLTVEKGGALYIDERSHIAIGQTRGTDSLTLGSGATLTNSGHIWAAGNYVQEAGSSLIVKIPAKGEGWDRIDVGGEAHLAGQIEVHADPNAAYGLYPIITATSGLGGTTFDTKIVTPATSKADRLYSDIYYAPKGAVDYARLAYYKQGDTEWASTPYAEAQIQEFIDYLRFHKDDKDYQYLDTLSLQQPSQFTMGKRGCLISSLAMALTTLGQKDVFGSTTVTPEQLNDDLLLNALISNRGAFSKITPKSKGGMGVEGALWGKLRFPDGADLDWQNLKSLYPGLDIVSNEDLGKLSFSENIQMIKSHLDAGFPVIVSLNGGFHWMLAWGYDTKGNFKVLDPGSSDSDTKPIPAGYKLKWRAIYPADLTQSMVVESHSPIEFLITSPSGKKLGYDPQTGLVYSDVYLDPVSGCIRGNSYSTEYPILDPDDTLTDEELAAITPYLAHTAFLNNVEPGDYSIQVMGTADGDWELTLGLQGVDGSMSSYAWSGTTSLGETQTFAYTVTPEPCTLALLALGGAALMARRKKN